MASSVDFKDPTVLLKYLNDALRLLQLYSDASGYLTVSSSTQLLQRRFHDLTAAQITELNTKLGRLGLRESKHDSGAPGGLHYIRQDVTEITMSMATRDRPIPLQSKERHFSASEIAEGVTLALGALREGVRPLSDTTPVGLIEEDVFQQTMEDIFALPIAGEVILYLRRLALYRIYTDTSDRKSCYVNLSWQSITAAIVQKGEPLLQWPEEVSTTSVPQETVEAPKNQSEAEQVFEALTRTLDKVRGERDHFKQRHGVASARVTKLEAELADARDIAGRVGSQRDRAQEDNLRLRDELAKLRAQFAQTHREPSAPVGLSYERMCELLAQIGIDWRELEGGER